jgi:2-dehydropantoate 2-reductase
MRVLIVGAGAIGGYFGARLIEAGRDATFLVRPQRAAKLKNGLVVKSPAGDIKLANPSLVTADTLKQPFDLVLLSCKAYDLASAIEGIAPAIGAKTLILPLLNGMSHMDALNARFGKSHVLGGWCAISTTLNAQGEILHLQPLQSLSFGEQDDKMSDRVRAVGQTLSGAKFDVLPVDCVIHEMWEKWIFIATAAGITCLMRGTVGDIATAAADLPIALLNECAAIATKHGFPPRQQALDRFRTILTTSGSPFTASMLRDIEAGARIEADHIVGDLLKRGGGNAPSRSLLGIAYAHLKTYEARRGRQQVTQKRLERAKASAFKSSG